MLRKPVALSASLLLRSEYSPGSEKEVGTWLLSLGSRAVWICTKFVLLERCCSTRSCTGFPKISSKTTSYAIFCFLEHTFLPLERQGEGYYTSRRDNAMGVLPQFQFLVLVSLFPHDDRSWKCTQALDPEGWRWGWEGKEEEGKRKRRTCYAPEQFLLLSQPTVGSCLGCRGQQVIHHTFPHLSPVPPNRHPILKDFSVIWL